MQAKSGKKERNVKGSLWTLGVEAGGPGQGGAVGAGQVNTSGSGSIGPQGEDLYTLEAEITELQRENARVESQVLRLRSDITAMEHQLKHGEKVSSITQSITDHSLMPFRPSNYPGFYFCQPISRYPAIPARLAKIRYLN